MTKILISRRKDQLAELIEVEHTVLSAIIFTNNVFTLLDCGVDILFTSEVVKLSHADKCIAIAVNFLEEFVWLKIWMSC